MPIRSDLCSSLLFNDSVSRGRMRGKEIWRGCKLTSSLRTSFVPITRCNLLLVNSSFQYFVTFQVFNCVSRQMVTWHEFDLICECEFSLSLRIFPRYDIRLFVNCSSHLVYYYRICFRSISHYRILLLLHCNVTFTCYFTILNLLNLILMN